MTTILEPQITKTTHGDRALVSDGYYAPAVPQDAKPLVLRVETKRDEQIVSVIGRRRRVAFGAIRDGAFVPHRIKATSEYWEPHIRAAESVVRNPDAAAKRYAKVTGNCWRCGRVLTDPASIRAAIGPDCAKAVGMEQRLTASRAEIAKNGTARAASPA